MKTDCHCCCSCFVLRYTLKVPYAVSIKSPLLLEYGVIVLVSLGETEPLPILRKSQAR